MDSIRALMGKHIGNDRKTMLLSNGSFILTENLEILTKALFLTETSLLQIDSNPAT